MLFKSPRGTKDILPRECRRWQVLEAKARSLFALYAFSEVRTPVFEEAKLFTRSLGELSDIVSKQMFVIQKDTDTFVLRPEATASVIRAYVEAGFYAEAGLAKYYYMGPMFRAERPQKGRLRQFHQLGCEAIGSYQAEVDADLIVLAADLLTDFGLRDFEIHLNSLGCLEDKKKFARELRNLLVPRRTDVCGDCQSRIEKNVFRVLDCKKPECRAVVASLNLEGAMACPECRQHLRQVRDILDSLGVAYQLEPLLVRGLDYYTRTVFEISHAGLGSQDALGAGGRYDHLVEELGGPARGAVGFAIGLERVLLALGEESDALGSDVDCYIVPLGDQAGKEAAVLLRALRRAGWRSDMDGLPGSIKSKMRRADKSGSRFCLILGEDELRDGVVTVKDMKDGRQQTVPVCDAPAFLKSWTETKMSE